MSYPDSAWCTLSSHLLTTHLEEPVSQKSVLYSAAFLLTWTLNFPVLKEGVYVKTKLQGSLILMGSAKLGRASTCW